MPTNQRQATGAPARADYAEPSNDNPQLNDAATGDQAPYAGDPMTATPTLLRRIAAVVSGGETDQTVTDWATAFQQQYPEG